MIKSNRSRYAAKVASDLVLDIQYHCTHNGKYPGCWMPMSQVTVLGFSFGAHIASQVCINLYKQTKHKVGKLIGKKFAD